MSFTEQQYQEACARLNRSCAKAPEVKAVDDAVEKEMDLQDQIRAFLRERRWAFVWSPMGGPTTTTPGLTDFVIAAPGGRTLWIETKSRTAKLRPEQIGFKMLLEAQGHEHHVVRSYREFCNIIARK